MSHENEPPPSWDTGGRARKQISADAGFNTQNLHPQQLRYFHAPVSTEVACDLLRSAEINNWPTANILYTLAGGRSARAQDAFQQICNAAENIIYIKTFSNHEVIARMADQKPSDSRDDLTPLSSLKQTVAYIMRQSHVGHR
jgi:hypothetical protein